MTTKQTITAFVLFGCVLAVTVLVYWPGLSGSFVLDDASNIQGSQFDSRSWEAVVYAITHNGSGLLGRSVSVISFILTEWQFGSSPWGYKFHNLLLHLANSLLIFRLLFVLLPLLAPRLSYVNVILTAGLTTSFWVVHPLLVSTVLYAVQRMVELAVFFSLAALLSYIYARTRDKADSKFLFVGWILFPACVLLAILSKEIGALVLVYVIIIEVVVFKTSPRLLVQQRHVLIWTMFFILIPMAVAALYLLTHFSDFSDYSFRNFTLYERLLTQLHVLAYYARMIIMPRVKEMGLFHDDFPVTQSLDPLTFLLLGTLIGLTSAIWILRDRAPVLAFGIAWFLGSHLLESTFLPLELVFEHRNYLGAMGLLLPIVYCAIQIQKKELQAVRWFIVLFFILYAGQTYSRVQEWSNIGVLLTVAVNDHPNSIRAHTDYANYLYSEGNIDEAIRQLMITIELDSRDAGAVIHQLILLCVTGKRHEGLLVEAQKRLSTWPASPYAMNALINLIPITRDGRCTQLIPSDVETLISAALTQPGNISNVVTHSNLLSFIGVYRFDEGKYDEGVSLINQAYAIDQDILTLHRLAGFQIRFQQYKDAEKTIAKMEQKNRERFGIETQLVNDINRSLADSRENVVRANVDQSPEGEEILIQ